MQSKARDISAAQLVMLLFVGRMFSLMTYVSKTQTVESGSLSLLTIPLASIAAAAAALPLLLIYRNCGADPLTCAYRAGRPFGAAFSVLLLLYCLYTAAYTASHFEYFMTSTLYQNAAPWLFIFVLLLAAAYAASMGLEAFSRLSVLAFVLTLGVLILLAAVLFPQIKLAYVENPLRNPAGDIGKTVWYTFAGNSELILFLLFAGRSRTKNGKGKPFAVWLILFTLAAELIAFLLLTALGDFAKTRLFPMHTAAVVAQFALFGRLDLFHIITWVVVAFLRATSYIYAAAVCLRRLFPKLPFAGAAWLSGGTACLASLLASPLLLRGQAVPFGGAALTLLAVLFPLITLLLPKARGVNGAAKH